MRNGPRMHHLIPLNRQNARGERDRDAHMIFGENTAALV